MRFLIKAVYEEGPRGPDPHEIPLIFYKYLK